MSDTIINIGIYLTYALFAICVLIALVFPIIQLVGDFKKAKTALFGIIGMAAIVAIGYFLSSGEQGAAALKLGVGPNEVRLISAGLITTYVLMGITVLVAILSTVTKHFK